MRNYVACDLGRSGCILVARVGTSGPEAVARPYLWHWEGRGQYEKHEPEILSHLRYSVTRYRPAAVMLEEPISIMGRRTVGVSQGMKAGKFILVVAQTVAEIQAKERRAVERWGLRPLYECPVVMVKGQGKKNAAVAWGVLRQSLFEQTDRETFAEWNQIGKGEPGEHLADNCAVFLAGLNEMAALVAQGGAK